MTFFRGNIFIVWYGIFFIAAIFFNFFWEISHANLYQWLPPMEKTIGHLFWFSIKDALFYLFFILLVALVTRSLFWFKKPKVWSIILLATIGLLVATFVEYNALNSGKWAYASSMPVIPILDVGLTPILQMSIGPVVVVILIRLMLRSFDKIKF